MSNTALQAEQENKSLAVQAINPRKFADNKLGYIDDRPFGGGPGMIMMAPPLQAAIEEAKANSQKPAKVIYLSPQGQPLTHKKAAELAELPPSCSSMRTL